MLMTTGCSDPGDERLAEMSRQSSREQARQNERSAEQNRQIAAASRHLVEQDARARKALIETHADLQKSLHAERTGIDRQREELEQERREIATQRHRDPIIAAVLTDIGLTLACLLPLLLAAYVLYSLNHSGSESEVLTELLIQEMTAKPSQRLLPPDAPPRLTPPPVTALPSPETDPEKGTSRQARSEQ